MNLLCGGIRAPDGHKISHECGGSLAEHLWYDTLAQSSSFRIGGSNNVKTELFFFFCEQHGNKKHTVYKPNTEQLMCPHFSGASGEEVASCTQEEQ